MRVSRYTAKIIILTCSATIILTGYARSESPTLDYKKHIAEQLLILEKDPDNCLAIDQIGASYQVLYEEEKAIKYYEMLIEKCPGGYWEIEGHWKIGLSYIVMGQTDKGLVLLDKAIEIARQSEDKELYDQYLLHKEILIEKHLK